MIPAVLHGDECALPVCCGEKRTYGPGMAHVLGEPLALSCQLCPRSPTYWRFADVGDWRWANASAAVRETFPTDLTK